MVRLRKARKGNKRSFYRQKNLLNKIAIKLLVLLGVVLIALFIIGDRGLYRLYENKIEKQELLSRIDQLRAEQLELLQENDLLENDLVYIERLAREKYRMAKKGEKVFKIISKDN